MTADHKIVHEEHESRLHHTFAVVVQDLATPWIHSFSMQSHISSGDAEKPQEHFYIQKKTQDPCFRTILWNFFKHCEELNWKHERPTPRRSETDGIADRPVRRVKEGTSSVLVQSGLQESWWAETMGCCCYLRDVQDQSLQMVRHLMNVGSIHRLKGRLFRLEQK